MSEPRMATVTGAAGSDSDRGEHGPAPTAPAEPALAEVDTLILRVDLGEGCHTLITAGDPIPAHLAELPRGPRHAAPGKAKTVRLG